MRPALACPNGHGLQCESGLGNIGGPTRSVPQMNEDGMLLCDACGIAIEPSAARFSCPQCDHDVCSECARAIAAGGAGAKRGRESEQEHAAE